MTIHTDIRDAVETVVANHFAERLNDVYAGLQTDLGIPSGDISPFEALALDEAQATLTRIVANWLVNSMPFDRAEALGMDGTMRS